MRTLLILAATCLAAAPLSAATFTVDDASDAARDVTPGDGLCATEAGTCTLQAALDEADATSGLDRVRFALDAGSVPRLQLRETRLDHPIDIDGTSHPLGRVIIDFDGDSGLHLRGGGSRITGLLLTDYAEFGLRLSDAGGSSVIGNLIGTNPAVSGGATRGDDAVGILVESSGNVIGGSTLGTANVIGGNDVGVLITGSDAFGNRVMGNRIGCSLDLSLAIPNGDGVVVEDGADRNTIGGVGSSGNYVSGNRRDGVVVLAGVENTSLLGNRVGLGAGGAALPNGGSGVRVVGAVDTTIGGEDSGARNIVAGNRGDGIRLEGGSDGGDEASGTIVRGNYLGVDASGGSALANGGDGLVVDGARGVRIGGTAEGAGNVISGNSGAGLRVEGGAREVRVEGNLVGTDAAGARRVANLGAGMALDDSRDCVIGGLADRSGNLVSGNLGDGIAIGFESEGHVIVGNYVGTDAAGLRPIANGGAGVALDGADDVTIGGREAAAGNLISGNEGAGIVATARRGDASGLVIQGNRVGLSASGISAFGNGLDGISLTGTAGVVVGGSVAGEGNVIVASGGHGIYLGPTSDGFVIQGNRVGTDLDAEADLGNAGAGIWLDGVQLGELGGMTSAAANVVAGNGGDGIALANGTRGVIVRGNGVGVDLGGSRVIPNEGNGVRIENGVDNAIGGAAPAAGNRIAFNTRAGVVVAGSAARGNSVLGNRIYRNGGLAIDLAPDLATTGPDENDPGDLDDGPNGAQNAPEVRTVSGSPSIVHGRLVSAPLTSYRIEIYTDSIPDTGGYGEAETLLATLERDTDESGRLAFTAALDRALATGHVVSATATDPEGNTSEMARNYQLVARQQADLEVSVVPEPPIPALDERFEVIVTASSRGPEKTEVTLFVGLPGELLLHAVAADGPCTRSDDELVCDLGSMGTGDRAQVRLTMEAPGVGFYTLYTGAMANVADPTPESAGAEATFFVGSGIIGDLDADGWSDTDDNCPRHVNPRQEDRDSDGLGDICDARPDDGPGPDDGDPEADMGSAADLGVEPDVGEPIATPPSRDDDGCAAAGASGRGRGGVELAWVIAALAAVGARRRRR